MTVPSTPNPMWLHVSCPTSSLTGQERVQAIQQAQMQNNGIEGQQALPNEKSGHISLYSPSQSIRDLLTKQERQWILHALFNSASNVLNRQLRPRHSREESPLEQRQNFKEHAPPTQLQHDQSRCMLPVAVRISYNNSMMNDVSRSKVVGSRVVKSPTATMTAKSKPRSTPGMERRSRVEAAIIVFINNRLSAKAEILWSLSDTIGDFK